MVKEFYLLTKIDIINKNNIELKIINSKKESKKSKVPY